MSAYQPGIPTGTVNLDVDYQNLKNNFQQLDTTFGIDHTLFSNQTAQNGYHTAIHFIPQSPPTATAGYGELYTQQTNDGISTGQQIFYQFINGSSVTINTPLTRNFAPVAAANGSTFLPGGIILQWGTVTSAVKNTLTPVSFNFTFPNACYSMQGTLATGTTGSVITLTPNTTPFTGFNYYINTGSGQTFNFFWWALGN